MASIEPVRLRVRVAALTQEGENQRAFRLIAADGGVLPAYAAGAHVDVHIAPGLVRQYSLIKDGASQHYLLCVKKAAQSRGGSRQLYEQLQVGDALEISAPRNHFPLRAGQHTLLVAAGIGITPILSMAEELEAQGLPFDLHYFVRSEADVAFSQRLQRGFVHGGVHLHVSEQGASLRAGMPRSLQQAGAHAQVHACGPTGFLALLRQRLQHLGVPEDNVHSESFGPAEVATSGAGADAAFEIELAGSGRVFMVPAGRSMAEVLQEHGVPISLSCEQGMCGACLTGVVAGEPEHLDSVLSQKERAANTQVAICCSRSRSARLVLDLAG